MLRLSDLGRSVPEIAQDLNLHDQTARKYLKAFLAAEAAAGVSVPLCRRAVPSLSGGAVPMVCGRRLSGAFAPTPRRGETRTERAVKLLRLDTHSVLVR